MRGDIKHTLITGRGSVVFVPWADVGQIILYPAYPRGQGRYARVQCIRHRDGAPPLPRGNEQAPGCPVPGVAAGATRRIGSPDLEYSSENYQLSCEVFTVGRELAVCGLIGRSPTG